MTNFSQNKPQFDTEHKAPGSLQEIPGAQTNLEV